MMTSIFLNFNIAFCILKMYMQDKKYVYYWTNIWDSNDRSWKKLSNVAYSKHHKNNDFRFEPDFLAQNDVIWSNQVTSHNIWLVSSWFDLFINVNDLFHLYYFLNFPFIKYQ